MTHWILALLLFQPATGLERTSFVIVDTEHQCVEIQNHVLHPNFKNKHQREDRWEVKKAKCEPINMEKYRF